MKIRGIEIRPAGGNEDLVQVRSLFEEYWASFGFTPCFQNFGQELLNLPGQYAPPGGGLALAWSSQAAGLTAAGCIAFRRIDDLRCEAKRLYVRPRFRGCGTGRALLAWVIAAARAAGYREMLGDTMPEMARALEMYDRAGFERIAPYGDHPAAGAIFLRLAL